MKVKVAIRETAPLAPLPVVLVGSRGADGKPNVMTAAWTGICCSDPLSVYVSIRPARLTHRLVKEGGSFTINVPTRELAAAVDLCGVISGRNEDKFARAKLTAERADEVSAPIVAECPVNLECAVRHVVPLGVHDMFVGEVVAVHADEAYVTDGVVDFSGKPVISYMGRGYWGIGEQVGLRGFGVKGK